MKKDWIGIAITSVLGLFLTAAERKIEAEGPDIRVSLFDLVKPRDVFVTARLGTAALLLDDKERICRQLHIRLEKNGQLAVWVDGQDIGTCRNIHLSPSREYGVSTIGVPGVRPRDYGGTFEISSGTDVLRIINILPLEPYLAGVIGPEIGSNPQALRAQAVVSRTFACANRNRHDPAGYDFCDTTHCQLYQGLPDGTTGKEVMGAIADTQGMVLTYQEHLCQVFYHSTCGGHTNSSEAVWPGLAAPYLVSVDDRPHCRNSPHFRWRYRISQRKLSSVLAGLAAIGELLTLVPEKVGQGGWVQEVVLSDSAGRKKFLTGEEFRIGIDRVLGWNAIKSACFSVLREGNDWVFEGRGLGHGVGLCQWGAAALAEKGLNYTEILAHYFPGTQVASPILKEP